MQNKTQKTIIIDIPYNCRPENCVPEMLDAYSPTGYSDGQSRRRARREKLRKNKKY